VEVKDLSNYEGGMPDYGLSGTLRKAIPGWSFKGFASGESANSFEKLSASVEAKVPTGSTLKVSGNIDMSEGTGEVTGVSLDQPISVLGGTLNLTPDYTLGTPGLVVSYERDNTAFTVGGNKFSKSVTLAHTFAGASNTMIAPTLTFDGNLSVAFKRDVGAAKVSGTYVPDSALTLKYAEDPMEATLVLPVDGFYKSKAGARLRLKMALPDGFPNLQQLQDADALKQLQAAAESTE